MKYNFLTGNSNTLNNYELYKLYRVSYYIYLS